MYVFQSCRPYHLVNTELVDIKEGNDDILRVEMSEQSAVKCAVVCAEIDTGSAPRP